eukprot:1883826-Rhodomonas_salina.1
MSLDNPTTTTIDNKQQNRGSPDEKRRRLSLSLARSLALDLFSLSCSEKGNKSSQFPRRIPRQSGTRLGHGGRAAPMR